MTNVAFLPPAPAGYELVLCTSCGRPVQMSSARMLTCACGAPPPYVPLARACPDVRVGAAALVCVRKPKQD